MLRTTNNHPIVDVANKQSPGAAGHTDIRHFACAVHIGCFTDRFRQNAVFSRTRNIVAIGDLACLINSGQKQRLFKVVWLIRKLLRSDPLPVHQILPIHTVSPPGNVIDIQHVLGTVIPVEIDAHDPPDRER